MYCQSIFFSQPATCVGHSTFAIDRRSESIETRRQQRHVLRRALVVLRLRLVCPPFCSSCPRVGWRHGGVGRPEVEVGPNVHSSREAERTSRAEPSGSRAAPARTDHATHTPLAPPDTHTTGRHPTRPARIWRVPRHGGFLVWPAPSDPCPLDRAVDAPGHVCRSPLERACTDEAGGECARRSAWCACCCCWAGSSPSQPPAGARRQPSPEAGLTNVTNQSNTRSATRDHPRHNAAPVGSVQGSAEARQAGRLGGAH